MRRRMTLGSRVRAAASSLESLRVLAGRAASIDRAPPHRAAVARILVMPFENVKREGRIFWLGEASAVLLPTT